MKNNKRETEIKQQFVIATLEPSVKILAACI